MSSDELSGGDHTLQNELSRLRAEVAAVREKCAGVGAEFASNYLDFDTSGDPAAILDQLLPLLRGGKPEVRQAVLGWLADRPVHKDEVVRLAESIVKHDPDPLVRVTALNYLGKCFDGTRSRRYSDFYSTVVKDDTQPASVRLAAYKSLICLHDLSVDWVPPMCLLRFPDHVDWEFVNQNSSEPTGHGA